MHIGRKPRGFVGRLMDRRDARIQRDLLESLSDHTLRDIGIVRGQIDAAIRGFDRSSRG